jgi:hypothetical protein
MVALHPSEMASWSPYSAQIHARSVAHTPFQTVSLGNRVNRAKKEGGSLSFTQHYTELQYLHKTNWAIEDFHSDLSWWAMES